MEEVVSVEDVVTAETAASAAGAGVMAEAAVLVGRSAEKAAEAAGWAATAD